MDRGRNHSADDWRSDRLHHVGADAGLPENRNQAGKDGTNGHEFGPETVYSSFDGSVFHILICQWLSALFPAFKGFIKVDDHDHTGFDSDVSHRDCDAEVVFQQPLKHEPSAHLAAVIVNRSLHLMHTIPVPIPGLLVGMEEELRKACSNLPTLQNVASGTDSSSSVSENAVSP
jgi:hypothetical protein